MCSGAMNLFEMPVTCGVKTFFQGNENEPLDLRVETPIAILGSQRELLRQVVTENIEEMARRHVPVRMIVGASHNTNPFGEFDTFQSQNLRWLVQHTRALAEEHGMDFVPASFAQVTAEAQRLASY